MTSITLTPSSWKRVITYSDNHYISKCTIIDLLRANIVNWEHNRPPDLLRCAEIAQDIYTRRSVLDWILYMTYDRTTNIFYVVDGIHRYTALHIIYKENHKPHDYVTPNIFGGNGNASWLYEKYILICVRVNSTKGETVDWFHTLNKSNPVPDLYIANTAEEKRKIIEEVTHEWMRNFKQHFTSSQKPNIPNINRDKFIDLLDEIYEKCCIKSVSSLNETLYELNNKIRENIPLKISKTAIDKCNQTHCFLFLLPKDVLLEKL